MPLKSHPPFPSTLFGYSATDQISLSLSHTAPLFLDLTISMAEESEILDSAGKIENLQSDETPAPAISSAPSLPAFSFNIWPPSQRTRDAVTNRLIDNLSTPSTLSNRYGALPSDEASAVARLIEQEAFAVASDASQSATKGDEIPSEASLEEGIETLQIYSKEISRKVIESMKTRSSSKPPTPAEGNAASAEGEDGDVVGSPPKPSEPLSGDSSPLAA